jgi:hypothetical protein
MFPLSFRQLVNSIARPSRSDRRRARRSHRPRFRPRLEQLEDLTLLTTTINWTNLAGGSWNVAGNWDLNRVPTNGDDVGINVPGNVTVTYSTGTTEVNSITSNDVFALSGGTLTVDSTVQVNNTFTLAGGTLVNATVLPGSGGQGVTGSGTLRNVTMNADLDPGLGFVETVDGGMTLNGTLLLRGSLSNIFGSQLNWVSSGTLSGSGTVLFSFTVGAGTFQSSEVPTLSVANGTQLTIGPGITLRGNLGYIGGTNAPAFGGTIVNQGTISADSTIGSLNIQAQSFTNQGTVQAKTGGSLGITSPNWSSTGIIRADATGGAASVGLGGTFTLPAGHTFVLAGGGVISQTGTLNNTGNTVTIDTSAGKGTYFLNGTVNGGTLSGPAGSTLTNGGLLNGVTLNIDLNAANTVVTVDGGMTLNGTFLLNGSLSNAFGSQLNWLSSGTLSGSGTVLFSFTVGAGTFQSSEAPTLSVANGTQLTIGPGITLRGNLGYIGGTNAPAFGGTIVNQGTISADSTIGSLNIQAQSFTNQGTVQAKTGGSLGITSPSWSSTGIIRADATGGAASVGLGGTFTLPAGHTFVLAGGGVISQTGTLNNAGNTVTIDTSAGKGTYAVGGTINGGTITGPVGSILSDNLFVGQSVRLNGVTLNIDLDTGVGGGVVVDGGLTLNSTLRLSGNMSNAFGSQMSCVSSETIGGNGTILFSFTVGAGTFLLSEVPRVSVAAGTQLTIGPGIALRGNGGQIGTGTGDTIVNQGTISADVSSAFTEQIVSQSFTNQGIVQTKTGGSLSITSPTVTSSGTVDVQGGTSLSISSVYTQTAGSTSVNGTLADSNGVNIQGGALSGAGTINGNMANAGQVNPGNSPGTLTISGNYTQSPTGVLNIELGGTPAGQFDLVQVSGTAILDGTLNVILVGGFVPSTGNSFTIMTFASQTGDFATKNGLNLGGGKVLSAVYSSTALTLQLVIVNGPPVLDPIANQVVNEQTLLSLTAHATDPDAGQTLTFSLDSAPPGVAINAASGLLTWTPTEAQGPGVYTITVRVTDNGSPSMSDTKSFQVTVNEVNLPPVLSSVPASATIPEQAAYTFTATATDPDIPINTLTFSLQGTVPAGASIDPNTGVFTWTPTEAQGPGSYSFQVRVTDNGSPSLFDEKTIGITVTEGNLPPVLGGVPAGALVPVQTTYGFTATATDPDLPTNILTFSLQGTVPAGASINSSSGVFAWMPTAAQAGSYTFKVRVTDNGNPSLFDEKSITITVYQPNSLSGFAYLDDNNNGVKDPLEVGIPGVTVTLTGTDALGNGVGPLTMATGAVGSYTFPSLRPGTYQLAETQPLNYQDGKDAVGTVNGVPNGSLSNDLISGIALKSGDNGIDYDFGELATTNVHKGQTASIGFWSNSNGQALIKKFGPTAQGQSLADWLASSFPNLFGNLAGKSNADVAAYDQYVFSNAKLFNQAAGDSNSGMKLEAQVLGTALNVFATTQSLGGTTAAAYGFEVTAGGVGGASYNLAAFGGAFGLPNNTTITVLQLLQLTDGLTVRKTISASDATKYGVVYGGDLAGARLWRPIVNAVFDDINTLGNVS